MVITRTPFRISFFGGGTDYPEWYLKNGGKVLATTIDKYWSDAVTLKNKQVLEVVSTNDFLDFTKIIKLFF